MRIFCSLIALAGYLFAADIKTVHFPSEDRKTMLSKRHNQWGEFWAKRG